MFMGMLPFNALGTYSLLQYIELAEGIWYPVGGFYKVVEKLGDVGQRTGVKYQFNTTVKSIITSHDFNATKDVLLESGKELHGDIVIINADLVYVYNNLLPRIPSLIPFQNYTDSLPKGRPLLVNLVLLVPIPDHFRA